MSEPSKWTSRDPETKIVEWPKRREPPEWIGPRHLHGTLLTQGPHPCLVGRRLSAQSLGATAPVSLLLRAQVAHMLDRAVFNRRDLAPSLFHRRQAQLLTPFLVLVFTLDTRAPVLLEIRIRD